MSQVDSTAPGEPRRVPVLIVAVAVATPILGVALVWLVILLVTRRSRVDNTVAHATGHHSVPPLDETLDYRPAQS